MVAKKIIAMEQTGIQSVCLGVSTELSFHNDGDALKECKAGDTIASMKSQVEDPAQGILTARIKKNVRASATTLVFGQGQPQTSTQLTDDQVNSIRRPFLVSDIKAVSTLTAVPVMCNWIAKEGAGVMDATWLNLSTVAIPSIITEKALMDVLSAYFVGLMNSIQNIQLILSFEDLRPVTI